MASRGRWARRRTAAFSCGAIAALAGCSAGQAASPGPAATHVLQH